MTEPWLKSIDNWSILLNYYLNNITKTTTSVTQLLGIALGVLEQFQNCLSDVAKLAKSFDHHSRKSWRLSLLKTNVENALGVREDAKPVKMRRLLRKRDAP